MLDLGLQVMQGQTEIEEFVANSWRPRYWTPDGIPLDAQKRPRTNSYLSREEWEALDSMILQRATQKLKAWGDVMSAGLTTPGSLAEWYTKWRVASEVTEADVTMDFETGIEQDRVDRHTYGVPVPLISKMFSIGKRELITARAGGVALEDSEAMAATDAVTEKAEEMLIDGSTSVVIQGDSIPGYRTINGRYTTTADGDFGTISNILSTIRSMIKTMAGRRYRGTFNLYMAITQYFEMLEYYSDGTGDRAIDRVQNLPQIGSVDWCDLMTDGEFVAVQMSRDVVEIREAMPLQVMQYEHPSGNRAFFVVVMSAVPRIKTDHAGYSGVAHITSA
jgi:uncharacterized linocin/CFP29 family protein